MAYYNRGVAYQNKGDTDGSIADYTQAIQLDPKSARANFGRGIAYRKKGDTDRAIADYTEAIQLDPKYAKEVGIDRWLEELKLGRAAQQWMEQTLVLGIPANNSMKFPNFFAYAYAEVERLGSGKLYFKCDYTSQTCRRGVTLHDKFVGVVLDAGDRTTVLRHVECFQNFRDCNDFDKGIFSYNTHMAGPMTYSDIPASCVEAMRQHGEKCPAILE